MEYSNPYNFIFGLVGLLFWSAGFLYLFKEAQIFIPSRYKIRTFRFLRLIIFCIGVTGWSLISYSLMEPRIPIGVSKNPIEVNDIFFVVDVSASMLAVDFKPNRLEVAKKKMVEFVDMMSSDRIGVIIFSERIFTLLPLTTDLKLIKKMMKEIKTGFLGSGTNIGDALGLAVARALQSIAKSKIIILLTDGVSNVESITPVQAASYAKDKNIKIYAIGIGGKKGALMPGRSGAYRKIPGKSFDMNTLHEIAKATGGKAYSANNSFALGNIFSEIEKLEKTEIKTLGKVLYKELYYQYFFIGFMMLLFVELFRRVILREGM